MIKASQFKLASVQAAAFLADKTHFSPPNLLATVLGTYASRYDGLVQSIPVPDKVPPEFPRVILQSKDGRWNFQAGPARFDSFGCVQGSEQNSEALVSQTTEVLENYIHATSLEINRLGLIITHFCEVDNPAQELIDRFCSERSKNEPFHRSENFEIHNHKIYSLPPGNLKVNSWVRCKTALLSPTETRVILVEQDMNTLEDVNNQNVFTAEDLRNYYQTAAAEADTILTIYFPEEARL